jgi:hypothetical protein
MFEKELQDDVHDIDKRLVHMEALMQTMKDNHLYHIEMDMNEMKSNISKIDNRIFYGVIAFFFQVILIGLGVIGYLSSLVMG